MSDANYLVAALQEKALAERSAQIEDAEIIEKCILYWRATLWDRSISDSRRIAAANALLSHGCSDTPEHGAEKETL